MNLSKQYEVNRDMNKKIENPRSSKMAMVQDVDTKNGKMWNVLNLYNIYVFCPSDSIVKCSLIRRY